MKNIKCVIEARMGSKRLPGKSMMNLFNNYKVIDYTIQSALNSNYLSSKNIYLLTSKNLDNLKLIKYVKKNYKIKIIAGSENNVFSRYYFLKRFNSAKILRLTADNPLVDPFLIDYSLKFFENNNIDYLTSRAMFHSKRWKVKSDFPRGISLEIFKSKKLFQNENKFDKTNFHSPTWFFYNKLFKDKICKLKSFGAYKQIKKKLSFTIDTKSDYNFVKNFIKKNNFKPGQDNLCNFYKNK